MIEMSPLTRPDDSMNQSAISLVRTRQLAVVSENDYEKPSKLISDHNEQALTEKNRRSGKILSDLEKIVDGQDD